MRFFRGLAKIAAVAGAFVLTACGDLSRVDVERILNGDSRGYACVNKLSFLDGGFEKAKKANLFSLVRGTGGVLGGIYVLAASPDGDQWQVIDPGGFEERFVRRRDKKDSCLPGKVEVDTIADAPFAASSGSYKMINYTEVVTLPKELEPLKPYVWLRYEKRSVFQKTDRGWRIIK